MDFELHHHQQQQTPPYASIPQATSHFQHCHHHQSGHALTLSLPIHASLNAIHSPAGAIAIASASAAVAAIASPARPGKASAAAAQPLAAESERIGRDDCWSEGATFALIDAWGERYLELNRGNLKQKHWQDVAIEVNRREGGGKPAKTGVQCKNRLDTLKKKYKLEKSRIAAEGSSRWPFLSKLEDLIGSTKKGKNPQAAPVTKPKIEDKNLAEDSSNDDEDGDVKPYLNTQNKASSSCKDQASVDTSNNCLHGTANVEMGKSAKKRKWTGSPFKVLASAMIKFGEVYDKIESAKQQQLLELEKQRMEFTKDLELQRMQLFMQTQVELAKMKYSKHGSTGVPVLALYWITTKFSVDGDL